jgi:predicted enzyme related to lactoylglutathione lyase
MVSSQPAPSGLRHGDIGYVSLWVPDVDRAAAFFSAVLGWRYAPGSGPEGRQVEGLRLRHGLWGGVDHSTLFLCFAVEDLEAAAERVRAAGGTAEDPHVEPYGLIAGCTDPGGTRFALFAPPGGTVARRASAGTAQGDLEYVTMEVTSSAQAREFYGSVLGWRFSSGRVADGWQVDDVSPMVGLSGGQARATVQPMYKVDDIVAAVGRVRAAGGTASDPEQQPYGISAVCADDQGTRFYLGQL